ncbi:MAG: RNA 3'-terminal phosphate cyclase, partial [Candidatus Bathyarchaeia archaeon]
PIIDRVVWEALREMGFEGELTLRREGFYPKGGGVVEAAINPVEGLRPLVATALERVEIVRGISICGRLPGHVAERQARAAETVLREASYRAEVGYRVAAGREAPRSPGSVISLWAETEPRTFLGAEALGERGKPAEKVGAEAAVSLVEQLRTGAAVDLHTADSLVLWCSIAGGESTFTTSRLTLHTATAVELARIITGAKFEVEGEIGSPARIRCRGIGLGNGTS